MARGRNSRALFEVIKQSQEQQARRSSQPAGGLMSSVLEWFKPAKKAPSPTPKRARKPAAPVMRQVVPESIASQNSPAESEPTRDEFTGEITGRVSSQATFDAPTTDSSVHAERQFVEERSTDARYDSKSEPESSAEQANAQADSAPPAWGDAAAEIDSHAGYESTSYGSPSPNPRESADHVFAPDDAPAEADRVQLEDDDRASYSQTYATVHATAHDTAITTAITDDTDERPAHATTDTRSLQFSLSYPTMFIAAAAFLMLLTVAFLAGRKGAPRLALTGPTLEQLQQSKPSPEVMNLKNTRAETTLSGGEGKSAKSAEVAPRNEPVRQQPAAQPLTPDRRRIVGRNYIIAQSYPDPDNAEKAAALMQKNNIPVSVEQLDAAPGWYCVVTQVGFDRVSSPDCERYQKLIKDLSPQARSAKLKSFDEPYLYKWK